MIVTSEISSQTPLSTDGPMTAVLIEMLYAHSELLLFVVRPEWERPRVAQVDIADDELLSVYADYLEQFHEYLGASRDLGDLVEAVRLSRDDWLQTLASWTIKPVADWIRPTDLIIWAPYGIFHSFPLHLLPHRDEPLLTSHPVSYIPSASVLKHCQQKNPARRAGNFKPDKEHLKVATYGVDFEEEAVAVAKMFPQGQAYLASANKVSSVLIEETINKADIAHFSCHGIFRNESPKESGLVLKPIGKMSHVGIAPHDLLDLEAIYGLELNAWLVTLGACNTALSNYQAGDELMGIVRGFIYSGTPSVVASLWPVPDDATKLLMTCFYGALLDGKNKAKALQTAQLQVRESYKDPRYWAGFVLIGDWV